MSQRALPPDPPLFLVTFNSSQFGTPERLNCGVALWWENRRNVPTRYCGPPVGLNAKQTEWFALAIAADYCHVKTQMLGSNVPTVGGLVNGFKHADEWGCECIQVYLTPSRAWAVPDLSDSAIAAFKEAWQKSRVKEVVAHIPFLVNVASAREEVRKRAVIRLEKEVDHAEKLGVKYLVLHPGGAGRATRAEGTKRVAAGLREALQRFGSTGPKVLVETMAGQGSMIGSWFEEIAAVLEAADRPDVFGVCFDTSHVFFAGYDIRGYEGYEEVIAQFDKIVGIDQIRAFHVNDAKTALGSGCDRHANIGEGRLGLQVFHALVRDSRFAQIPKVLEIPDRDEKSAPNLALLKSLREQSDPVLVTRENDEEMLQLGFAGFAR